MTLKIFWSKAWGHWVGKEEVSSFLLSLWSLTETAIPTLDHSYHPPQPFPSINWVCQRTWNVLFDLSTYSISLHSFHTTSPKAQVYGKFAHSIINIKGNTTDCVPQYVLHSIHLSNSLYIHHLSIYTCMYVLCMYIIYNIILLYLYY